MKPFYLAGRWAEAGESIRVTSPYDGRLIGEVARPTASHASRAIGLAAEAFEQTRTLPAHVRADALLHISRRISERSDELTRLITDEGGKPLKASEVEVARAVGTFRWASEEARRRDGSFLRGDTIAGAEGRALLVRHFPRGVVLGIAPFNFPLNLVAHKVAPALGVGCPIVIKPATATPLTALALAEIVEETGLPNGAFSVLPLSSEDTERLVSDDRVRVVSFTGSPSVGWNLKQKAHRKQVILELGGNAAAIVHSDADLDLAAAKIAAGGFAQAGQSCISAQRILVQRDIYETAVAKIVAEVGRLAVGDPADPSTDVGPLIDLAALDRVAAWVDEAVQMGGEILIGGKREDPFYYPTVLAGVPREAKVCSQELFGPVVVVDTYETFEEALAISNDSAYGLQAGVFTNDPRLAFLAFRELEVGGVIVNDTSNWRADQMPYGGTKESGFGREGLRYAMDEICEPKVLVLSDLPL
ncbi:MAG: aldehyde dehydrogenase family protein [Actinomycetota bacterium]